MVEKTSIDPLLTEKQVLEKVGFKSTTLHRLVKRGEFPAPVRITSDMRRWPESEVAAYVERKKQERDYMSVNPAART